MPHIILEHSDTIKDEVDYEVFLKQVHEIFLANSYTDRSALKARVHIAKHVAVADGENAFIHLAVSVLRGRKKHDLENIAKSCKQLMHQTFTITNAEHPKKFSVEIREMNNELYFK